MSTKQWIIELFFYIEDVLLRKPCCGEEDGLEVNSLFCFVTSKNRPDHFTSFEIMLAGV